MNMSRLLVPSIGRISLTVSAASPMSLKYNLPPCDWCWAEFLSLYSSIIFAFLQNCLSNMTGYPCPICATKSWGTASQSWEVSMSNVTRLFAFAMLMIALHRVFFGSSYVSSTLSPLDEDILVWAQILWWAWYARHTAKGLGHRISYAPHGTNLITSTNSRHVVVGTKEYECWPGLYQIYPARNAFHRLLKSLFLFKILQSRLYLFWAKFSRNIA